MRVRTAVLPVAAAILALAPVATAHVTLNPRETPANSFTRFSVRVPNERDDAGTTKVTVRLPESLEFISFQPKPGWTRTVTREKLAQPVTNEGETITDRIATVTWSRGRIAPGEFEEFGMSTRVPDSAGEALVFPAVQTYDSGEIVRWIGEPDADTPAPRVMLTAAATQQAAEVGDEEGDDEGRANLALGLGAAGLVAGLAGLAVALSRRRTGA